jgi:hypothetical protein
VAEVGAVENLGGLLGQGLALVTISPQADPTSLLGAVPRFGKPTPTLSSSKVVIVHLSKATVAGTAALRLGTAVPSHMVCRVIRKPPATLSNNHKITTTLSTIKVNTLSNNRSVLPPFKASFHSHTL